jgi:hypothetical protein
MVSSMLPFWVFFGGFFLSNFLVFHDFFLDCFENFM